MPSDDLLKYWGMDLGEDDPQLRPVYYMTLQEQLDREVLNVANTASAMRARIVAELAKENGGQSKPPT